MPISIASAKAKGRSLQQKIVAKILAMFPTLVGDDVVSCPMGSNGLDVRLSPVAAKLFPFAIECKARKSIAITKWLEQACGKGRTPIVFMKGDRQPIIVAMYADDFFKLIK